MDNLFEYIKSNRSKRVIVGLDGLSRSGKTTLVGNLVRRISEIQSEVVVFHLDDYIEERSKRYDTGKEQWQEYYYCQWNVGYLRGNLFSRIHEDQEIKLNYYLNDKDTHIEESIELPKTGVILVEGVFLQRAEWRSYLDYVIFLDCPRNVRFIREDENTQKNVDKFTNRYWKAEDFYIEHIRPKEIADLVIEN